VQDLDAVVPREVVLAVEEVKASPPPPVAAMFANGTAAAGV